MTHRTMSEHSYHGATSHSHNNKTPTTTTNNNSNNGSFALYIVQLKCGKVRNILGKELPQNTEIHLELN